MKKSILIGILLTLSLSITACSDKNKEVDDKDSVDAKQEQNYATEEELAAQNEKVRKELHENTKYMIAKIVKVDFLDLDIEYVENPSGYNDRGYSEDLDINTDNLKSTGKKESIDMAGAESTSELEDFKVDAYVRVGIYDSQGNGSEVGIKEGKLLSVDVIK